MNLYQFMQLKVEDIKAWVDLQVRTGKLTRMSEELIQAEMLAQMLDCRCFDLKSYLIIENAEIPKKERGLEVLQKSLREIELEQEKFITLIEVIVEKAVKKAEEKYALRLQKALSELKGVEEENARIMECIKAKKKEQQELRSYAEDMECLDLINDVTK